MNAPAVAPATWYERKVLAADLVIAVVFTVVLGLLSGLIISGTGSSPALILISFMMTGSLAIRRTRPVLFVGAVAAIAVAEMLVLRPDMMLMSDLVVVVAVHTAARYCPRWFGYSAFALALFGSGWAAYRWVFQTGNTGTYAEQILQAAFAAFVLMLIVITSYALGRAQLAKVRAITAQLAGLAERNEMLRNEHEQQLKLATEQERGRIAAETHDILAHSLAIIVAQADGAAMLVAKDPQRAQGALGQIADTSREALAEVRQKVAALRRGEDPTADLAPAKSLADLDALLENVRSAGICVTLRTAGDLLAVLPGPSLSAYRIVQEALTNTIKHGGPAAHATVTIEHLGGTLHLCISDDGRGVVGSDGEGNGLTGMRARVDQYGGVLAAGPRVGGGFRVEARIPLPALDR